jgi:heme A synthase
VNKLKVQLNKLYTRDSKICIKIFAIGFAILAVFMILFDIEQLKYSDSEIEVIKGKILDEGREYETVELETGYIEKVYLGNKPTYIKGETVNVYTDGKGYSFFEKDVSTASFYKDLFIYFIGLIGMYVVAMGLNLCHYSYGIKVSTIVFIIMCIIVFAVLKINDFVITLYQ